MIRSANAREKSCEVVCFATFSYEHEHPLQAVVCFCTRFHRVPLGLFSETRGVLWLVSSTAPVCQKLQSHALSAAGTSNSDQVQVVSG